MCKPVRKCYECEEGLYEGDEYYELDGDCICPECIGDYLKMHYRRYID